MNERYQNALNLKPQACPPIWLMRQAGRYHDHYQELKKNYTFKDLCTVPELAAKTALGPIEDFDFDASIYFNDILYPLEALGFDLEYAPGPKLAPVLTQGFLATLNPLDQAHEFLAFQKNAVAATRELLPKNKSLIGFIGGAWTLFTYAAENTHQGHLITSKTNIDLYKQFCEHLLPLLNLCIKDQLASGAEVVMIFDTSAGPLDCHSFATIVKPALEYLCKEHAGRIAYYAKGTTHDQMNCLKDLPLAGRGFDHRFDMSDLLQRRDQGFIQGNFDQTLLFTDPKDFKKRLLTYLAPLKELSPEQRAGWVCGLGHGVLPKTPQENVRMFVDTVREVFHV